MGLEEKDYWQSRGVDGRIILKWILGKEGLHLPGSAEELVADSFEYGNEPL
jgi:hypothetical protein